MDNVWAHLRSIFNLSNWDTKTYITFIIFLSSIILFWYKIFKSPYIDNYTDGRIYVLKYSDSSIRSGDRNDAPLFIIGRVVIPYDIIENQDILTKETVELQLGDCFIRQKWESFINYDIENNILEYKSITKPLVVPLTAGKPEYFHVLYAPYTGNRDKGCKLIGPDKQYKESYFVPSWEEFVSLFEDVDSFTFVLRSEFISGRSKEINCTGNIGSSIAARFEEISKGRRNYQLLVCRD